MNLENLKFLREETVDAQGLKVQHSLHCLEGTEFSKLSVPGFGDWLLVIIEGQLITLLLGGLPEKMRENFCFNSAELPSQNISHQEMIESFVGFLLESFAETQIETN